MKQISEARFNAFCGYARSPSAPLFGAEIAWFESGNHELFAAMIIDTDQEFSGIFFAADLAGRFRWVGQTGFVATIEAAAEAIEQTEPELRATLATGRIQGDERVPVDFFTPVKSKNPLSADFITLTETPGYAPALELISTMMRWYDDVDRNFIEQFQTTAFDARIWELYLFAMLVEIGFHIGRPKPAPDFLASGLNGSLAIEATIANLPGDGVSHKPTREGDVPEYFSNYLPTRFGGPLTAKLKRRYWEREDLSGIPLTIAVQDFHDDKSMTYSGGALQTYLYGKAIVEGANGEVRVEDVVEHRWGPKVIPSNFFNLPDAEHVSAVLFNGAGTLTKFNRIGVGAGFGEPPAAMIHEGVRFSGPALAPLPFRELVEFGYPEKWVDGLVVFHNPTANPPLNPDLLPGAAHHHWDGEKFITSIPDRHLDSSFSTIIQMSQ